MMPSSNAILEPVERIDPCAADAVAPVLADGSEPIARGGAAAIVDQAVVSGTNFLTMVMIARACSQEEVGVYALAWTIVLFLAAVQSNLVSVPYTMYCHRRAGETLAEYSGSAILHQTIASLLATAGLLAVVGVLSFGLGSGDMLSTAWVVASVMPFILLRDFARRFAFAHLAMGTAIAVDLAVAALQLGGLFTLWRLGRLSAATGYAVAGGACAVASLGWWLSNRQPVRFANARIVPDWRENWAFGRWALTGQLTGLSFYALPWLLAAVHGKSQAGEFGACNYLVGLSNLFVLGMNNFIMPRAAQAFHHRGASALMKVVRTAMGYSIVVLGSLCIFAFFAGNALAHVVFGAEYADTGLLITVLAVATFTDALGLAAGTGLWAVDRPAANFRADFVQMVTTLAAALWLVFPMGAIGIATALVIGRVAGASVRWITLLAIVGWGHSKQSIPCRGRTVE